MTDLTWGDGIVLTDKYNGKFRIIYRTSTEAGAWRLYFESYKGSKITYELYEGDRAAIVTRGMSLYNRVKVGTVTLKDVNGKVVV